MNEHPYWTVLTVATALITISVLIFVGIGCCWAWAKLKVARLQVRSALQAAAVPDERFETEHRQLLAEEGEAAP